MSWDIRIKAVSYTHLYYYSLVPGMADILREQTEEGFNALLPEVVYEESES